MDCNLLGFSVHGILQARILVGSPFPSPGDLPDPGMEPRSPALEADTLTSEPPGKRCNATYVNFWFSLSVVFTLYTTEHRISQTEFRGSPNV